MNFSSYCKNLNIIKTIFLCWFENYELLHFPSAERFVCYSRNVIKFNYIWHKKIFKLKLYMNNMNNNLIALNYKTIKIKNKIIFYAIIVNVNIIIIIRLLILSTKHEFQ